ncbi:hypothetical protein BGZ73_007620 [Actinomortierella ambigua]|nr:hypothetical protein BGZ73_007620 [Actinomortierella ambigua]
MNPPTRFLRVSNMARKMSIWDAREMFEVFGDVKGIFTTYLRTDGVIYLEFFDIRRAAAALEKLHGAVVMQHMILIEYCSKQDMSAVSRDILSNVNDGNVMVSMSNPRLSEEDLLRLMRRYGDIVSYENQLTRDATTIMVAYYDTRCAATAVKELQEMNQKGTVQCQAHYTVQHQPREPFLQWPTSYSMSSALHPAASATRFVQDIDDRASFESVSTSPSSNALHSRDGADLVATTSRFLDSIVIPSVVERVGSLSLSSPPTPNGFTTHKKERGQTPLVMTASSRSSSADTIDAKGTDRNNAAALSTALSMTPHTTTTDSSPSTSSTSSTTTSNKSRTSRRARSFSAESCTGESKPLRPSPSSDPSPTTGITASPSSLVSSAEKPSSKLSGRNSNKGPLSDLIEGNEGPNDRRTTLMVRNIPNKYTQQMFYEWINDTHHGKFDFLYLRIDFKNKCNVGYAFVNFVSVEVIESFAQAHVGRKWPRFNSDKICELAYATVQGRDALVEKFRNSSVMKEDPNYRPKLFYTSGPRAGGEKPFPESNLDHEHPSKSHHSVRRRHSSKA